MNYIFTLNTETAVRSVIFFIHPHSRINVLNSGAKVLNGRHLNRCSRESHHE